MTEPTTEAGRWLVDRSQWDEGLRAFRVRINATAGPEDMLIHVLAIEREAAEKGNEAAYELGWDEARADLAAAIVAAVEADSYPDVPDDEQPEDETWVAKTALLKLIREASDDRRA